MGGHSLRGLNSKDGSDDLAMTARKPPSLLEASLLFVMSNLVETSLAISLMASRDSSTSVGTTELS
jgi:hypothetical protein